MTIADLFAGEWRVEAEARLKPSTWRRTTALIPSILDAFGPRDVRGVRRPEVQSWVDGRRSIPGSANRALDVLSEACSWCVGRGLLERNPCSGVVRLRLRTRTRFLSRAEAKRLLGALDRWERFSARTTGADQCDLIRMLLWTGCRVGEMRLLQWDDWDGGTTVRLRDGKTGPRTVWLSDRARGVLARRRAAGGTGPFVFGGAEPPSAEVSVWKQVRARIGLADVRLHDLRHTFASHAVMNGTPIPVVSRLLGHASVRMTMRYAHLGDAEVAEWGGRIGDRIGDLLLGGGSET